MECLINQLPVVMLLKTNGPTMARRHNTKELSPDVTRNEIHTPFFSILKDQESLSYRNKS